MTGADDDLARLAERAGIEPGYWDIAGHYHETTPETARALLAALGIAAEGPAAVRASLATIESAHWRRVLPPVTVAQAGTAMAVEVVTVDEAAPVPWRVVREDGGEAAAGMLAAAPVVARTFLDGRALAARRVALPADLPPGYHRLHLEGEAPATMALIVAPARCFLPRALADGGRLWGVAAQVYALREDRDWGMGDLGALAHLGDLARAWGAATVGINPLHALFAGAPERASPYAPSSRLFLDPLYLDLSAIPDLALCQEVRARLASAAFARRLAAARARDLVAYAEVAALKRPLLEALYRAFAGRPDGDPEVAAFRRFVADGGERLRRFALFEALAEHFGTPAAGAWPAVYRDPAAPAVADFAAVHERRIAFFQYLQWRTDQQLANAARGPAFGLYRDLALGSDPDGAEIWAEPAAFAPGARIGAPPDPFNALGQEWGLPPFHPTRLREAAYAPFIALLRANMRYAGALRLDHAMGLRRLYWVPAGAPPAAGAYVRYPFEDLLAILALESRRQRCAVIGEDLGTVPEGFRPRMKAANVLSYRVLYFERAGERFKPPQAWPRLAAACVATHDLPTLTGFWSGRAVAERARLGLHPSTAARRADFAHWRRDRRLLLQALADEGLLPAAIDPAHPARVAMTPALMAAIHAYLARTPCCLLMVQIDDLAGEAVAVNLPGTVDQRPNWRRRLAASLDTLAAAPARRLLSAILRREGRALTEP